MIIMNDTTITTDWYINTGFFVIFISCFCNLDSSCSLSPSDSLCLTGNTDRSTTDTDFDKVSATVSKETETIGIYNVTSSNLHGITIMLTNPINSKLLPFAESFTGIDTKHVYTCFYQRWYTFCIISCINSGTNHISLVGI